MNLFVHCKYVEVEFQLKNPFKEFLEFIFQQNYLEIL